MPKLNTNYNLLIHLVNSQVKYAEKIKDLECRLDNQQEELAKQADIIKKIKSENDADNKIEPDNAEDINNIKNVNDEIKKIKKKHSDDVKMLKQSLSSKQPITPVIGFHVSLSKGFTGSGKIPFDKILSNAGNGWNSITHVFRVPAKGLYFLTLTVMNFGSSAAYSALMRGSTRVALAYANGGDHANSATVATVLLLDAGEFIYAEHRGGTLHGLSPDHYTYLAGFLIQKTN